MVSVKLQKRLAASIMSCGKRKVWIDPSEAQEICQANSSTLLSCICRIGVDAGTARGGGPWPAGWSIPAVWRFCWRSPPCCLVSSRRAPERTHSRKTPQARREMSSVGRVRVGTDVRCKFSSLRSPPSPGAYPPACPAHATRLLYF